MFGSVPPGFRLMLLTGAAISSAAGVLLPYGPVSGILFVVCAVCWIAACIYARDRRPELRSAIKFIAAFGMLGLLGGLLADETLSRICGIGIGLFGYFSVSLLCASYAAMAEQLPYDFPANTVPPVVKRFEYCAGLFVLGRILPLGIDSLAFIADLIAMATLLIGFTELIRYWGGKNKNLS